MQGAAEVSVCYEDATALAFMDIYAVNNGHTLVVRRHHFELRPAARRWAPSLWRGHAARAPHPQGGGR